MKLAQFPTQAEVSSDHTGNITAYMLFSFNEPLLMRSAQAFWDQSCSRRIYMFHAIPWLTKVRDNHTGNLSVNKIRHRWYGRFKIVRLSFMEW